MLSLRQFFILLMSGLVFPHTLLFADYPVPLPETTVPFTLCDSLDFTTKKAEIPKSSLKTISIQGASFIRIKFDIVHLGANSLIKITSHFDKESQILNTKLLKDWQNTSAYFNGDCLTIELIVAPGETGTYQIKEVLTNKEVKYDLDQKSPDCFFNHQPEGGIK